MALRVLSGASSAASLRQTLLRCGYRVTLSDSLKEMLGQELVTRFADPDDLGGIEIHKFLGLSEDGKSYDTLVTYGGRSFTILNAKGQQVFDSGAEFEKKIAELVAAGKLPAAAFNADNDGAKLDQRSDRKVRAAVLSAAEVPAMPASKSSMPFSPSMRSCTSYSSPRDFPSLSSSRTCRQRIGRLHFGGKLCAPCGLTADLCACSFHPLTLRPIVNSKVAVTMLRA